MTSAFIERRYSTRMRVITQTLYPLQGGFELGFSAILEAQTMELNPAQVAVLKSLLRAGFKFITFERYARYLGIEREGFVALLETDEGKVRLFGQVGYQLGDGIGMLVERPGGKAFLWKGESVAATFELLAAYERFRADLRRLLQEERRQ